MEYGSGDFLGVNGSKVSCDDSSRHWNCDWNLNGNVLMRLSVVDPPLFLLAIALVVENEADCSAAVTGPGFCCWRFRVSWHMRETEGRAGAIDIGTRKTLAKEAKAGDNDFIVLVVCLVEGCWRLDAFEVYGGIIP